MHGDFSPLPPRFAELKQQIATSIPGFEKRAINAWSELLKELKVTTNEISTKQTEVRSSKSDYRRLLTSTLLHLRLSLKYSSKTYTA